ncbi:hypothetical protein [Bradyrhizobium sp. Ce-3]|nr:hypothetical protein [Bradyrhizobium sp. Ce-3]GKQ52800.1 hypothetical protein BRSPCE3_36550 [Bradyrhizobium sp. Ce-3]
MQEIIAASVIVAIVAFCGGYFWAIVRETKAANRQQRKRRQ